MAECFICKRKIDKFHDKLEVSPGKQCCYKCAPYVREVNKAGSDTYPIKKRRLVEYLNNPTVCVSSEAKKEIYYILERLDSKHAISSEGRAFLWSGGRWCCDNCASICVRRKYED